MSTIKHKITEFIYFNVKEENDKYFKSCAQQFQMKNTHHAHGSLIHNHNGRYFDTRVSYCLVRCVGTVMPNS